MLTALVAVVAASAPAIKEIFAKQNSVIRAVMVGEGQAERGVGAGIALLVSNDGDRIGAVNDVRFRVRLAEAPTPWTFLYVRLRIPGESAIAFVKPNATEQLVGVYSEPYIWSNDLPGAQSGQVFRPAVQSDLPLVMRGIYADDCELLMKVTNASGSQEELKSKFACRQIRNNTFAHFFSPSGLVVPTQ